MLTASATSQPRAVRPSTANGVDSSSIHRTLQPGDLDVLFQPEINIAVLERGLSERVRTEVQELAPKLVGQTVMLTVAAGADAERELCEHFASAPHLAADMAMLVELLADLTGSSVIGVRLAHRATAMCPRLHVDRVTLRLVVSYLGAGTEFVDESRFDRSLLAANPAQVDLAARGRQARDLLAEVVTEQAEAGDVVLLKGESWPGNEGRGAVHRSPRAIETEPRLVLTLDAL